MATKKAQGAYDRELRRVGDQLKFVSHAGRLHLVMELLDGPKGYESLSHATSLSRLRIAFHLKHATIAGIVEAERRGHKMVFSLTESGRSLVEAVDAFSVRTAP